MDGLLAWYDANRRDLPWRHDTDRYRVLVSEVMLQQTRVDTVRPRFEDWMRRFPDVEALAAADEEAVMAAWSGLGYYRRARNLHAAARRVAATGWPHDAAGLRALPGIGPYTAAAIASISFGESVPAIDGNLERVLSRVFDIAEDVTKAAGKRAIRAAAEATIDRTRPGDWNQALMDLGATVCTPMPACERCPLTCQAAARGTVPERPVRPARKAPRRERMHFAFIRHGEDVLVTRREAGLLAGTWGLPGGPVDEPIQDLVREQTGVSPELSSRAATLQHTFTHRVWDMTVQVGTAPERGRGRWHSLDSLDELGLSTAARRAIEAVQRM